MSNLLKNRHSREAREAICAVMGQFSMVNGDLKELDRTALQSMINQLNRASLELRKLNALMELDNADE
jgi:hypothetical protein